ncbi:MAG: PKD domain-containing protein, partial [Bacteroidota bacterium]
FSFLNDCPTVTTSTITVNGLPEAAFIVDTLDGCPPFAVQFTNASIGANNYTWDFGDNSPLSFAENPVHIFEESGDFTVSLVVFDSNNCFSDTTSLTIFSHPLPEANFTYDANALYCARYDSIFFENISTGAIDQFWVFQNDTFFTQDLVLPVEDPGDFQISLTVQNVFGCTATTTQTFSVAESPLVAFDPSSAMGCEDLLVSFSNNAQFSDFFTWNFDGQNTSTQFEPSYLFTEPGTYPVQLIGTNTNGCPADTSEVDIMVWPKPQAIFSFEKDFLCGTPVVVQFLNESIGNVGNEWSFGDGNVSIQVEPDNEYLFPGLYDVVLEVVSDMGCRDTAQQTIDIFGQPEALISLSDPIGCELLSVSLGNNSVDGQTFLWTVEGIGTFPVQDTTVVLPEGTYDVQLIAAYNDQCQDTLTLFDAIQVFQSPIANFTFDINLDEAILGDVQFFNLSEKANRYEWNFGDGNTSTEESPLHIYEQNRPLTAILFAYQDNGGAFTCVDSLSMEIEPEWMTRFFAHNAFSPDYGPEAVRFFKPVGIGIEDYEISVYSPYGTQVWYSKDLTDNQPSGEWDGTHLGQDLPQGTYSWIAFVTYLNGEKKTYKGNVTILR